MYENPFYENPFYENPFYENPFSENPFYENPFYENHQAQKPRKMEVYKELKLLLLFNPII